MFRKIIFFLVISLVSVTVGAQQSLVSGDIDDAKFESVEEVVAEEVCATDDNSQFVVLTNVVPDAILEIRYYSTYNFVGDRIDGYEEPTALLTRKAAEALKAVMDYLFDEVGVNKVESRHDPRNPNSGAVMRKCGMKYEGTLRQSDWNNQGICDASYYGLLASER